MIKTNKKVFDDIVEWNIESLPINFPNFIRKKYEINYIKNRSKYTNWVDLIGKNYKTSIDWWMTLPSYRNPYESNLLNYLTVLDTLNQLKKDKIKINIFTHSQSMAYTMNFYFKNKFQVNLVKKWNFLRIIKNFLKSTLFQLVLFFLINILIKKRKSKPNEKIIIVDQFITLKRDQNLNFYQSFRDTKKTKTLIAPTLMPTLNFFKLFKIIFELLKKNNNFIFKEHYLKFSDLFYSFTHIVRRGNFLNNGFRYKNLNLSKLVNEEIKRYDDFFSINSCILNYLFFKRASLVKINFIKSINWFENQIIDKGWNLGFRTFYSKIENHSFGHQDFSKHYNLISHSPSSFEYKSKVTPEKIVIISSLFNKITKEFFSKQKIIIGKSWRFKNILKIKKNVLKNKNKILLVLCGIKKIDRELLKLTIEACRIESDIKIFIKPHPVLDVKDIIPDFRLPNNMIVIEENLQKILSKSLVSITAGPSSAILESINLKTFLILIDVEAGTKKNTEIFNLKKSQYVIVENAFELIKKINSLKRV